MTQSPDQEQADHRVCIIDDEACVREALMEQLELLGYEAVAFASATEYLQSEYVSAPGCILLDIHMSGMSGIDLQAKLASAGSHRPIIFITGSASIHTSVHVMKAGAIDYLMKPFDYAKLVSSIDRAFEQDTRKRIEAEEREQALICMRRLTPRETEVMEYVSQGLMNKQIAFQMGISEIMVKLHRGRMMRKMDARSVPDIVRKFDRARLQQSSGALL